MVRSHFIDWSRTRSLSSSGSRGHLVLGQDHRVLCSSCKPLKVTWSVGQVFGSQILRSSVSGRFPQFKVGPALDFQVPGTWTGAQSQAKLILGQDHRALGSSCKSLPQTDFQFQDSEIFGGLARSLVVKLKVGPGLDSQVPGTWTGAQSQAKLILGQDHRALGSSCKSLPQTDFQFQDSEIFGGLARSLVVKLKVGPGLDSQVPGTWTGAQFRGDRDHWPGHRLPNPPGGSKGKLEPVLWPLIQQRWLGNFSGGGERSLISWRGWKASSGSTHSLAKKKDPSIP